MQDIVARATALYKKGDLAGALAVIGEAEANALPLAGFMLKGNIHARMADPLSAGETFLSAARRPDADRPLLTRLAAKLLRSASAAEQLANAGVEILAALPDDKKLSLELMQLMLAEGEAKSAAPFVSRLDLHNPVEVMLGINILREAGDKPALLEHLERALAIHSDDGLFNAERFAVAQDLCDFARQADCLAKIRNPKSAAGQNMFAAQALHRRLLWCDDEALNAKPGFEHFLLKQQGGEPPPRRAFSPAGGRIKLAYLSNDFYAHATMILFREVLMAHDRERFDIRLFSYTPGNRLNEQADWPEALRAMIEPIGALSDQEAAAAISRWGADILIDLKGHTGGARMDIVRLSDAPVKATYLGYPGSVSDADLDYAITDRIVTPDTSRPHYEEKLCRLPESYQPNDCASRPEPGETTRKDHGLREDTFIFASFNNPFKITHDVLKLWAEILKRTAKSIFWCYCPNEAARGNLLEAFGAEGIAAERIIFAGNAPYSDHISRVKLADLVLDTRPYNGHTTASDALWAGALFLAFSGNSFASRVSESLLEALDLPELVARDPETYVDLAVSLHEDRPRLVALRQKLAENRCIKPLFDSERLTRHLEAAYEQMAEQACSGLPFEAIDVAPLPPRDAPFF